MMPVWRSLTCQWAACPATRASLLVAVLLSSGCAYYNGIYNAKSEAHKGDVKLRTGRDEDARVDFALSAAKAETVLVRFPRSRWRTRALFLSGRGAVLAGQCDNGVPRLNEFMSRADADPRDRDLARVAYAVCDIVFRRLVAARARLDSLLNSKDHDTAIQARLWAARAALAFGDRDAAGRYLATINASSLQWELVTASQTAQDWVHVESLLVQRAAAGDFRADVPATLRDLWQAGRFDGVEEIVRRYDMARLRDRSRVTLHYAVGDLALRAGRDSTARQHLFTARRLAAGDTVIERESDARLALLAMARVSSSREVDTIVARIDSMTRRSQYYRHVADQLLLYRLLEGAEDPTGASLFLAAEVARDSLKAPRLAFELFRRVGTDGNAGLFAPKALAAAALLMPDSAPSFRARILATHPQSAVAAWLRGDDPGEQPDFASADFALRQMWFNASRSYADSLRRLRDAETRAKASAAKPRTP